MAKKRTTKGTTKKKFVRGGRLPKEDGIGKVRVTIQLGKDNGPGIVKGNVNRCFTVDRAKVSDVADAIEQSLFS